MSLLNDTFDDSGYGHEDFKTVIEDHLPILSRADNIDEIINVTPIDAARWEYDFSGLLRFLGVQPQYHWATMRVNGLRSADEYRSNLIQIKIPSKWSNSCWQIWAGSPFKVMVCCCQFLSR